MSKCHLSIELEDGVDTFVAGQTVRGQVIVQTDANVQCNALEVQTSWTTHGFGNVTGGVGQNVNAFTGQWLAGQTYRYAFELQTATWPPTYHGYYLNVDHAVEAKAVIPWSFDPKTDYLIKVLPATTLQAASLLPPPDLAAANSGAMKVVGCVFFAIFAIVIVANPFAWLLAVPIGLIALVWWFVFRFLPRARLGQVAYEVHTTELSPGEELRAELRVQPKRNIRINRVVWRVIGEEVCVSGSGSNRKTRRHTVFEHETEAGGPQVWTAEQLQRVLLSVRLPETPAYTLELADNRLEWRTEVHVDIPSWPDWKDRANVRVIPPARLGGVPAEPLDVSLAASADVQMEADPQTSLSFAETVQHLWAVRDDPQQTKRLVDAVVDLPFEVQAVIERRLLYGNDDPAAYRDGYVVWAHYPDPELPLTLFAPRDRGDEFEHFDRTIWKGRGRISGYDRRHGRLKIQLD